MNAIGICRICFEPIFDNENYTRGDKTRYPYHDTCIEEVDDIDGWEEQMLGERMFKEDGLI